jgi:thiol-disulfide isomerase/thioredoxin
VGPLSLRVALAAAAVAALATPALAGGVRWHQGDLDSARRIAREEGKLVMVDAWADWCRYCHVMDRELWSRDDVAEAVASVAVPVKVEVDTRRGVGTAVAQRYDIGPLPLVLLLAPENGAALARVEGRVDFDRLRTALRAASLVAWPARELARLPDDLPARLEIARGLLAADHPRAARVTAESVIRADGDCTADARDDAALIAGAAARALGDAEAGLDALAAAGRACPNADAAASIWERALTLAEKLDRPERRAGLLAIRAELRPGDIDGQLAWARWLRENGEPAKAERVLRKAAERAPDDPGPLAALADLAAQRGQTARALELLDRAIELAPFDESLRSRRLELSRQRQAR